MSDVASNSTQERGFHVMVKPVGPLCNLDCEYCFYSDKASIYPHKSTADFRMTDAVLEAFVRKYIESQDMPEIPFAWQGGEPALMGLDFFRKVVSLQKRYSQGKTIINAFQTSGTLLDDKWCEFLAEEGILVGLSLDGPEDVHDRYRLDKNQKPTFHRVKQTLELLKRFGVEFNILACVTDYASQHPQRIYNFFKEQGVRFIQFTPVVEQIGQGGSRISPPPAPGSSPEAESQTTDWSVNPNAYADFMISVFDAWIRSDVGQIFVMNFEWALAAWLGVPSGACVTSARCGDCMVMEHNGDIYACDHYVYPEYRLGNILTDFLPTLAAKSINSFGSHKETSLPKQCVKCPMLFACRGDCPKYRFVGTQGGEPGLSYLCQGHLRFFNHISPYMRAMRKLAANDLPVEYIMQALDGPLVIRRD